MEGKLDLHDYLSNALAYAAADAKAAVQVDHMVAKEVEKCEGIAYLVAQRLAVLEAEHKESLPKEVEISANGTRFPAPASPEEQIAALRRTLQATGHKLVRSGAHVKRLNCRQRAKPGKADKWLNQLCAGVNIEGYDACLNSSAVMSKAPLVEDNQ